jgi:hypothetical protein
MAVILLALVREPGLCIMTLLHIICACAFGCSTLQDKILQSMGRGQAITITNDGATILKSIYIDNPAAKVLVGKWRTHHQLSFPLDLF